MDTIQSLVEQLGSADQAEDFRAYRQLWLKVAEAGAPGADSLRTEAARELAAQLNAQNEQTDGEGRQHSSPKYSAAVRGRVARLLSYVADENEVEALQAALADFDTREMARWALDGTPCGPAAVALASAANNGVGPEFRVGAVNALGRRNTTEAIAALAQAATDADPEVRLAAVEGLAGIARPESDLAVASVLADGTIDARGKLRANKARVRLAETLASAGQRDAAKRVYEAILTSDAAEPQKDAARRGLSALA